MTGINTMLKKLLFITALCLVFNACDKQDKQNEYDDYDYDGIEVIVVSKTPRGARAGEEMPEEFQHVSWHEIGLSRNGEEPIEYIWRANDDSYHYAIMNAEIGDKGTIRLDWWAKQNNIKLPQPNAEKPPIIGGFREVFWEKRK
jgi:hypothetical protein